MSNSNKEQIIEETKHTTEQPKSSTHRWPWGIVFIIALCSLSMALFNLAQDKKLQSNLITQNKTVELLQQEQKNTQEQTDAKIKTMQQTVDNLNQQVHTALNEHLHQNQQFLLLKARYYMELAQINAHWSTHFQVSIELLQQANSLLQQVNSPKIFEIRQAITQEITVLHSVSLVDTAGILSQLDAAQTSVGMLTLQSAQEDKEATVSPKQSSASSFRTHLKDSLALLKRLVVIRRYDEDIKPLMSPMFESILKENIRLNLEAAQWAVLNSDSNVYAIALKQAITNIKRTFDPTAANTSTLLKQLNELEQIKLNIEKPPIGQALPLLNQLIENNEGGNNQ